MNEERIDTLTPAEHVAVVQSARALVNHPSMRRQVAIHVERQRILREAKPS